MSSKHQKKHHEEEQGEGWIVSFADLMTLMMSFFVIMAAGNPQDAKIDPDFKEIIAAVKEAFNYLPPADSNDPVDLQILMNQTSQSEGPGAYRQARRFVPGQRRRRGQVRSGPDDSPGHPDNGRHADPVRLRVEQGRRRGK